MNRKYTAVYEAVPITETVQRSDDISDNSDIQVIASADPEDGRDDGGSGCAGFAAPQALLLTLFCGIGTALIVKKRLG